MKEQVLTALLLGEPAGQLHRKGARLSFTYEESWRRRDDVVPISLSMPLAASTHGHDATNAYLWGLLPDNDRVLQATSVSTARSWRRGGRGSGRRTTRTGPRRW